MSSLGTEWIDNQVKFMSDYRKILEALSIVEEYRKLEREEEEIFEANFYDEREALMRIRPERTYMEELDLFNLKCSLQTVGQIIRLFSATTDDDTSPKYPTLKTLVAGVASFDDIVSRIDSVLNKFGKIKDNASPQLLQIRRSIELTTRSINHNLRSIIQEAQTEGYIERDVSPTLRDGRLVIPVAPSAKRKIKGVVHDESASGKTVFVEPTPVVEANNKIRELQGEEKREVIRILQELSSFIRPKLHELIAAMQLLAHVDYIRAVTSFSDSFSSIVPELLPRPHLDWVHAVHPLLQKSLRMHGKEMSALDIRLQPGQKQLVISGPNAGGKSVCLKTIGLLQYMLQCGMPVPLGERSKAGIFEGIFLDIGDEQSIEDDLSTYSSHLLNMKTMMRQCSDRTLLLIDEFGSGTEPQIGGALAEAILRRFVEKETYAVITTHYQNLKRLAEEFDTVVNGAMLYDRGEMQPLFRLQIGNPGSSFAIEIARKIGIPEDVIEYAAKLVGENYILSDKYLQDIVRDKMYWENKRRNIHKKEKQLEETAMRYEGEVRQLEKERKDILERARIDARQMLSDSNAKIENTIRLIKEAQAERERTKSARQELDDFKASVDSDSDDRLIEQKMEKIRRRRERREMRKREQAGAGAVQPSGGAVASASTSNKGGAERQIVKGDTVCIKGQTTVGRVEAIVGKQARVLFGVMYTMIPLSRLVHAEKPKQESISRVSTFLSKETRDAMYEKKLHFKPELDVRGLRADETMRLVATYIDDAIQLEYPMVRILHGTGTGALREVVRQYLATVPGVKRFHDEHVQFGGAGLTVVEFD